jgi:hypothetical protein
VTSTPENEAEGSASPNHGGPPLAVETSEPIAGSLTSAFVRLGPSMAEMLFLSIAGAVSCPSIGIAARISWRSRRVDGGPLSSRPRASIHSTPTLERALMSYHGPRPAQSILGSVLDVARTHDDILASLAKHAAEIEPLHPHKLPGRRSGRPGKYFWRASYAVPRAT